MIFNHHFVLLCVFSWLSFCSPEIIVTDEGNNESILIIDDEPSVGDALRLMLEAKGHKVVLVNNGRDGLEMSRKQQFAFVIVDLFLTDAYGLDLIKEIRAQQPALPILLITGHGSPEVFAAARRLGAVGALSKPFQPADILTLIAKTLDQ
jgi:DNA-binding NtrC family response regulator